MSVYNNQDKLARLKKYNNSPAPIVSVYFHLPDAKTNHPEVSLNNCSDIINHDLSSEEKKAAKNNLEYILGFLENYEKKNSEQSLALFSGGDSLFEIIHLPYKVKNAAYFSHSPIIEPILEQESVYRRFLIVLIDREKALYFILSQGLIEKSGKFYDPSVPRNVHADTREDMHASREDKINRHIEDHLNRHFERLAHEVTHFINDTGITGIIVGGHKNLFQKFEHHLPKNLQEKVVGEFISELDIDINSIYDRSKKMVEKINQKINTQQAPFLAF